MTSKKKYAALFLTAVLAASLTACGAGENPDSGSAGENTDSGSRILIAYFTAAENSGVDGEAKGRMQALAEMIQAQTGGDLFSIQTEEVYPADGGDLIDYAADEQDEDARPELSTHIESLDDYDTIFVGYPNLEQGFARV